MRYFTLNFIAMLRRVNLSGWRRGAAEVVLEIQDTFRECAVYIEEYQTFTEEIWSDQLPPGAKTISARQSEFYTMTGK